MSSEDSIAEDYDEIADEYADFYDTPAGKLYLHITTEQIHSYLEKFGDPITVLDIGCGQCTVARRLADRVSIKRFDGVDISTEMVERARHHLKESTIESTQIECADLRTYEYANGEYDIVLAQGNVASYVDVSPFLEQISSALKPGGYGFVSVITRHRYILRSLWTDDWNAFVRAFNGDQVNDRDGVPMTPYRVDALKSYIEDVNNLELVDIYPKVSYLNQLPESHQTTLMNEHWEEIKQIELENANSPDNYHGTQTEFVVRRPSPNDDDEYSV